MAPSVMRILKRLFSSWIFLCLLALPCYFQMVSAQNQIIAISEPPELPEPPEIEAPEGACSCAVNCCTMPSQQRRRSIYFHMPLEVSFDCCGCVVCPSTLYPYSHMFYAPGSTQPVAADEIEPPEYELPEVEIAEGK